MMKITERPATQTLKRRSVDVLSRLHEQEFHGEDPEKAAATDHQRSREVITEEFTQDSELRLPFSKWKPEDSLLKRLTGDNDLLYAFFTPCLSRKRLLAGTWERLGLMKFAQIKFRVHPREKIVSYCLQMQVDEAGRVGGADPFSGKRYSRSNTELCEILGFHLPPPTTEPDWGTIDKEVDGPGWRQMLNEHAGRRRMGVRGLGRGCVNLKDIIDDIFRSWLTWVLTWLLGKPSISSCSISDFNVAWELWIGKLHPLSILIRSLKGGKSGVNVTSTAMAASIFAHAMGNLIVPMTPKEANVVEDKEMHHLHWTRLSSKRHKRELNESDSPGDRSSPNKKQPLVWREQQRSLGEERETCRGLGQRQRRLGRGRPPGRWSKNSNTTPAAMAQHADDLVLHCFEWNDPVNAVEVITKKGAFVAARAPEGNRNPHSRPQGRESQSLKGCTPEATEKTRDDAGTNGPRPLEKSRKEVLEKRSSVPRPTHGQPQPWGALTIDEIWENFVLEKSSRVVSDIQKKNLASRVEWLQEQVRKTEDELRQIDMFWKASYQKDCSCRVRAEGSRKTVFQGEKGNGTQLGHAGPTMQTLKEREGQVDRLQMLESTLEHLAGEFKRVTDEKQELQNWVNTVPAAFEKMKQDLLEKLSEKGTAFANANV